MSNSTTCGVPGCSPQVARTSGNQQNLESGWSLTRGQEAPPGLAVYRPLWGPALSLEISVLPAPLIRRDAGRHTCGRPTPHLSTGQMGPWGLPLPTKPPCSQLPACWHLLRGRLLPLRAPCLCTGHRHGQECLLRFHPSQPPLPAVLRRDGAPADVPSPSLFSPGEH